LNLLEDFFMRNFTKFCLVAVGYALSAMPLSAASVTGFDSSSLPSCDDCFSDAVALGFSANYFGTTYSNTFVGNNGYVTFNAGQGLFSPQGLGLGYAGLPIIAAFFTDIDTRSSGVTSYGTGTFGGRNAFGVNWDAVGQFSNDNSAPNTFQLLLVDRSDVSAGDFDIIFNYDDIQNGRGASVGYNAGINGNPAGTFFQLPSSLNGNAFGNGQSDALITNSNIGIAGRYLFAVRNGAVVPPGVPEPSTWAMMISGFALVGGSMRYRRRRSIKVSYT
jgi:Nidogen-like/PEP-CTERM motif